VVAVIAATRWAIRRPSRALPLAVALAGAAGFVLLRNHYELEDSPFMWTLLAVCSGTFAATASVGVLARQRLRSSLNYGLLAAALVPLLFAGYIVLAINVCWVTSCDMS
jgi:hypothetical protein